MLSDNPILSIPHREPFLWVSRLMQRDDSGKAGIVEFDVKPELPVFEGHFPGNPIFPGVLQMEAAAQACMWVLFGVEDKRKHEGFYASIDSFKFKHMVKPGDVLTIDCNQEADRRALQKWAVQITNQEGKVCSMGRIWMKLGEAKS